MISQPMSQTQTCPCCGQPIAMVGQTMAGQPVVCQPAGQQMMGQPMMQQPMMARPAMMPAMGGYAGAAPAQPTYGFAGGLPDDTQIEEMIWDAIDADPLIPYDADIDIKVEAGTVQLTGDVPSKRIKHAAGDDAFWAPGVIDVRNDIKVTGRKRRGQQEQQAGGQ